MLTATAEGPAAVPPGVRVARAAVPWPKQLLGGGRRSTSVNRWVAVPDPYFAWVGPAVLQGPRDLQRERFDVDPRAARRGASAHLVAAVLSRARRRAVAGRLPRPVVDVPVPPVPDGGAQGGPREARGVGAGPGRRRDGGQPAHRRRPRRAAPVARRPRARAAQRLRPRRAAGGRLARRRLLDRPHRPPVRPRAAGRRVPRGARGAAARRQGAVRRRRREPRAARTPTGSASATACASSRSCRCRVALGYQRAADALLLVNGRRPESMSSKVFEYLQAGRPVFAISPAGSAARGLFAEVGGGTCVLPDDPMAGAAGRLRRRGARRRGARGRPRRARALRARPPHHASSPASSTASPAHPGSPIRTTVSRSRRRPSDERRLPWAARHYRLGSGSQSMPVGMMSSPAPRKAGTWQVPDPAADGLEDRNPGTLRVPDFRGPVLRVMGAVHGRQAAGPACRERHAAGPFR